jgi:hypothetical protein
MAITSIKTGSSFTNLIKYNDFLAGNPGYDPAATFLIQRTAATGSSGTITFSSIPQNYKHLQVRFSLVASAAYQSYRVQFNSDTADTNYVSHGLRANGTNVTAAGYATGAGYSSIVMLERNGTVATYPNVGIIDLHDYASTTKYKTTRTLVGGDNNSTDGSIELDSGLWTSTSAITSITFKQSTGTFTGTIALYGMVG